MKRSKWANEWYTKGLHELEAAKSLRRDGFYDMCALLSQQAAEMIVKALWIDKKNTDPPRVHWIEKLVEDLEAPESVIADCEVLVADYFASRYPAGGPSGPFGEFLEADADDRLARAARILEWADSNWANNND